MKSFQEHRNQSEYSLYLEAIELYESNMLNEFISGIAGNLKKYYDFIKNIAQQVKVGIKDIAAMLKNKKIFEFFQKIKFSMVNLFSKVKLGFKYYKELRSAISEYLSSTKVVKWTEEKLRGLDAFLSKHPKTKRLAGVAVGAILLYIWLNMSFTGDFDYDFDQSTLISALMGNFTLSDIFSGPEGIKLITLFVTGTLFSFPWPGPQAALFSLSLLYGLSKTVGLRDLAMKFKQNMSRK